MCRPAACSRTVLRAVGLGCLPLRSCTLGICAATARPAGAPLGPATGQAVPLSVRDLPVCLPELYSSCLPQHSKVVCIPEKWYIPLSERISSRCEIGLSGTALPGPHCAAPRAGVSRVCHTSARCGSPITHDTHTPQALQYATCTPCHHMRLPFPMLKWAQCCASAARRPRRRRHSLRRPHSSQFGPVRIRSNPRNPENLYSAVIACVSHAAPYAVQPQS